MDVWPPTVMAMTNQSSTKELELVASWKIEQIHPPASYFATSVTPFVMASTIHSVITTTEKLDWTDEYIPVKSPAKAYWGIMNIFSVTFQRSLSWVKGLPSSVNMISGPSPDWDVSNKPVIFNKKTYMTTHLNVYQEEFLRKRFRETYVPNIFLLTGKPIKCLHQHNSLTKSIG